MSSSFARRINRDRARALVLAQARAEGCTCDPDITLPSLAPGKVRVVTVAHDHDCPRCEPEHGSAGWRELRDRINAGEFDEGPSPPTTQGRTIS
jgi:hypothetical protein